MSTASFLVRTRHAAARLSIAAAICVAILPANSQQYGKIFHGKSRAWIKIGSGKQLPLASFSDSMSGDQGKDKKPRVGKLMVKLANSKEATDALKEYKPGTKIDRIAIMVAPPDSPTVKTVYSYQKDAVESVSFTPGAKAGSEMIVFTYFQFSSSGTTNGQQHPMTWNMASSP